MVNDMGVDPEEWFENPRPEEEVADYITDENAPCDVEYDEETNQPVGISPPAPDKLGKDDWFENPLDRMPIAKDEDTMHEKMYKIATARYNPFSIGGSENCDSDISCNLGGGSENMLDK